MHVHTLTHTHVHTHARTHECMYTRAHTCTHTHECMHKCIHTHTHTHIHTHTYTHTHTHTRTHTHTHTCRGGVGRSGTFTLVDATLRKVSTKNTVMWLCITAGILFNSDTVLGNMDLTGWVDSYQSIHCTLNTEQKFRHFGNLQLHSLMKPGVGAEMSEFLFQCAG